MTGSYFVARDHTQITCALLRHGAVKARQIAADRPLRTQEPGTDRYLWFQVADEFDARADDLEGRPGNGS